MHEEVRVSSEWKSTLQHTRARIGGAIAERDFGFHIIKGDMIAGAYRGEEYNGISGLSPGCMVASSPKDAQIPSKVVDVSKFGSRLTLPLKTEFVSHVAVDIKKS